MGRCDKQINNEELLFLQWDSDYFEVPSYKLTLDDTVSLETLKSIYNHLPSDSFLTVINESNNKSNNIIITSFFKENVFFADFNIRFVQKCNQYLDVNDVSYLIINNADYDKEIDEISKTAFRYSRFFNDNKLNYDKKMGVYSHWVNSAFCSSNRFFLKILDDNQTTIAFLLFNFDSTKKVSTIELIAINNSHKNQGLGSKMINILKKYLFEKGINLLYVGTQSENIEAMNFYSKNIFKVEGCNSIYHVWKK